LNAHYHDCNKPIFVYLGYFVIFFNVVSVSISDFLIKVSLCIAYHAELERQPLIFVMKMDETELIHNQKFERVSITFMNKVLDNSMTPDSIKYDGLGQFTIQWHLAGDMKPIKALYGLQSGANANFFCIYCN